MTWVLVFLGFASVWVMFVGWYFILSNYELLGEDDLVH